MRSIRHSRIRHDLVNKDPNGEGWMIKIKISDPAEVEGLLILSVRGAYKESSLPLPADFLRSHRRSQIVEVGDVKAAFVSSDDFPDVILDRFSEPSSPVYITIPSRSLLLLYSWLFSLP